MNRSPRDPVRTPCQAPIHTPPSTLSAKAGTMSMRVLGKASPRTAETGRCCWVDHPRSPRSSAPSHRKYCAASGSSNPYRARMRALTSVGTPSPRAEAGSPGARCRHRKASVAAARITNAHCQVRASRRVDTVSVAPLRARYDRDRYGVWGQLANRPDPHTIRRHAEVAR